MELLEDHHEAHVKTLAKKLGLEAVGWIFTDLEALDLKTGTVKHFRGNIVSMPSLEVVWLVIIILML